FIILVVLPWRTQTHRQDIVRIESGIDLSQVQKTLDQQSCACKQDEGERDLRNDQQTANSIAPASVRSTLSAVLECLVEIRPRGLEGGKKSEHESGQDCHA